MSPDPTLHLRYMSAVLVCAANGLEVAMFVTITQRGEVPFLLLTATFAAFGYGLGLVTAAGNRPGVCTL